jgi:hypothetical protein
MPAKKTSEKVQPIIPKKRGRKPKGGKIITVTEPKDNKEELQTNVIVHLKCKKNDVLDLDNSQSNESNILSSNISSYVSINHDNYHSVHTSEENTSIKCKDKDKVIHEKLKALQVRLHNNTICETNSACFWCTYEFSNLPIAIPKFEMSNTYYVYGCFCSPECAVAHLMNENIDNSTKFERYHLLSYIYSKVFNYENNIKPAPNPHYMLKKFCGNLTIEEYRELFKSHNYLFIIDKPITRELPELHEEFKTKNDFTFKSKNQIINKTFSVNSN